MALVSTRVLLGAAGAGGAGESYWIVELSDSANTTKFLSGGIDDSGNVYAVGLARPSNNDFLVAKYDTDGQIQWQRTIGSSGNDSGEGGAVDSSGNFYAVGTAPSEVLAVKYNSTGGVVWQNEYDTGGTFSRAFGAALDSSDNLYMCGITSNNGIDLELIKVNSSGTHQWTRNLGDSNFDFGYKVAIDGSDNVYISGYKEDASSNADGLIAKYNSSGTLQWHRELGGSSDERGYAVTTDSSGNVYLGGETNSQGTGDACFIAKYNSSGTLQWQRNLDDSENNFFRALACDPDDNVYGIGRSRDNTDNHNVWLIVKYNSSGTLQWQRTLDAGNFMDGYYIAGVTEESIYLVGQYDHTKTDSLLVKLPTDGSLTGTYVGSNATFVYAASSLTDSAGTLTDSAGGLSSSAKSLNTTTTTYTNTTSTLTSATTAVE